MSDLIEIGTLRQSGNGMERLFEAVKVARLLGAPVTVELDNIPVPAPEGEEREYDKARREKDSEVITFYAETGLE